MAYLAAGAVVLIIVSLGMFFVVTFSDAVRFSPRRQRRNSGAGHGRAMSSFSSPPHSRSASLDQAEEELRLRYARGEIGREEFLQRKIDLER